MLFDPLFSTEGLNRVPRGYVAGLADRVHAAGGLVIADEVQSGFGRTGDAMWGFELHGIVPDLATLGKPMGNGHPLGGVVTTDGVARRVRQPQHVLQHLCRQPGLRGHRAGGAAGNGGPFAAGQRQGASVPDIQLRLREIAAESPAAGAVKGRGLFFGVEIVHPDGGPWAEGAKAVIEHMKANGVLVSRIGPDDNVLKMRPPMVIGRAETELLLEAFGAALRHVAARAREPRTRNARGGHRKNRCQPRAFAACCPAAWCRAGCCVLALHALTISRTRSSASRPALMPPGTLKKNTVPMPHQTKKISHDCQRSEAGLPGTISIVHSREVRSRNHAIFIPLGVCGILEWEGASMPR